MKLRSLLKTGGAVGLGVFALSAVQSGTAFAAGAGDANSPMGWAPMPDPADGTVVSPLFSPTQTVGERSHLEIFDKLDFDVFSHHDRERRAKAMPRTFAFTSPTLTTPMASTSTPPTWLLWPSGPRMCGSRSTLCE